MKHKELVQCAECNQVWGFLPSLGITESLKLKRTSKIIEPTRNLKPHTHMFFECPWQCLPGFDHSFWEDISPNLQPRPPLAQPEAVSSHPVPSPLGAETKLAALCCQGVEESQKGPLSLLFCTLNNILLIRTINKLLDKGIFPPQVPGCTRASGEQQHCPLPSAKLGAEKARAGFTRWQRYETAQVLSSSGDTVS